MGYIAFVFGVHKIDVEMALIALSEGLLIIQSINAIPAFRYATWLFNYYTKCVLCILNSKHPTIVTGWNILT